MAFLDKVKPVRIRVIGSRLTPEEKCRAKMIALIDKQAHPKKGRRSWFLRIGNNELFVPRYANVNLVHRMSRGKKNAFPIYRNPQTTLSLFTKDVQDGKLDRIMMEIAAERSKQLVGKRRKKKASPVWRTRAARASSNPKPEASIAPATD